MDRESIFSGMKELTEIEEEVKHDGEIFKTWEEYKKMKHNCKKGIWYWEKQLMKGKQNAPANLEIWKEKLASVIAEENRKDEARWKERKEARKWRENNLPPELKQHEGLFD